MNRYFYIINSNSILSLFTNQVLFLNTFKVKDLPVDLSDKTFEILDGLIFSFKGSELEIFNVETSNKVKHKIDFEINNVIKFFDYYVVFDYEQDSYILLNLDLVRIDCGDILEIQQFDYRIRVEFLEKTIIVINDSDEHNQIHFDHLINAYYDLTSGPVVIYGNQRFLMYNNTECPQNASFNRFKYFDKFIAFYDNLVWRVFNKTNCGFHGSYSVFDLNMENLSCIGVDVNKELSSIFDWRTTPIFHFEGEDKIVSFWDNIYPTFLKETSSGKSIHFFNENKNSLKQVSCDKDFRRFYIMQKSRLTIYDTEHMNIVYSSPRRICKTGCNETGRGFIFSPEGKAFIYYEYDDSIVDVELGLNIKKCNIYHGRLFGLTTSGILYELDKNTLEIVKEYKFESSICFFDMSDNSLLLLLHNGNMLVSDIDGSNQVFLPAKFPTWNIHNVRLIFKENRIYIHGNSEFCYNVNSSYFEKPSRIFYEGDYER